MLIAHLSDLHLRDDGDVTWLGRQLDHIAARNPAHLAITGDLLDRWDPPLLARALDCFAHRGLLDATRLTILHGNHDLASSGGHPRQRADLYRMALRFWDPPPLVAYRRRLFHSAIERRAPGVIGETPFLKTLDAGARLAVVDTVKVPWRAISYTRRTVTVRHAIGCVRRNEMTWLSQQNGSTPLIVLAHHYPLEVAPFRWTPVDGPPGGRWNAPLRGVLREVCVPMAIGDHDRRLFWDAAQSAGVRLVLCGHVHRARLEWRGRIAIGLNGQSGASWAGRTVAFYDVSDTDVTCELWNAERV